jgi:hypothetical protein
LDIRACSFIDDLKNSREYNILLHGGFKIRKEANFTASSRLCCIIRLNVGRRLEEGILPALYVLSMALAMISRLSMGKDLIEMRRNSSISNLLQPPGCLTYSWFVCDSVQLLDTAIKSFEQLRQIVLITYNRTHPVVYCNIDCQ